MQHTRLKSSNLYSIAHDGADTMEVRFLCQACNGTGAATVVGNQQFPTLANAKPGKCSNCKGDGFSGTYSGKVPAKVFEQVKGDKSPGQAFNRLVRGNSVYKLQRQP